MPNQQTSSHHPNTPRHPDSVELARSYLTVELIEWLDFPQWRDRAPLVSNFDSL